MTKEQKRNSVLFALQMDEKQYANYIHLHFVAYCDELMLKFGARHRRLVTDEAIWKYYQNQWLILVESWFLAEFKADLENLRPKFLQYRKFFEAKAYRLREFYPAFANFDRKAEKIELNFNPN